MTSSLYWFRNDLRLHDNLALTKAVTESDGIQFVFCHPPRHELSPWGFERQGPHRRIFLLQALAALRQRLQSLGHPLIEVHGDPAEVLPAIAASTGVNKVYCEAIEAPYEQEETLELSRRGLEVTALWQSSLLDVDALPFEKHQVPDIFTIFRQSVEQTEITVPAPLPEPTDWPACLAGCDIESLSPSELTETHSPDGPSSFPYRLPSHRGGETAALAHLRSYLQQRLPHTYKATRNQLMGLDYSSKFSPWLAQGALSARRIYAELKQFESEHGANEGTYWLWFELLWRDYFRLLHFKYGRRLYQPAGLMGCEKPRHDPDAFDRWRHGETGNRLIDAGMRELAATGYSSNRMRQILASYLIHELHCDWRAGAAWFESQLVDYDVYSNQGNWLYIAGLGTDPRGGRHFNVEKQAKTYDPDGHYQQLWSQAPVRVG